MPGWRADDSALAEQDLGAKLRLDHFQIDSQPLLCRAKSDWLAGISLLWCPLSEQIPDPDTGKHAQPFRLRLP